MQSRSKQEQERGWRLVVPGGRAPVDLADGKHLLGASLDSTLLIGLPWGRIGARLHVAGATLRIAPCDTTIAVLLDGERIDGVRELRPDGSSHALSIGDVGLQLSAPCAPETQATAVAGSAPAASAPRDKPARRGAEARNVKAGLALATVLLILVGASASRLPVDEPVVANAFAAPAARSIVSPRIQPEVPGLKMQTDERGIQVATGVLRTWEACARMDRVRLELGAGAFIDRTFCLPGLQDHAAEWLAGTGLTIDAEGDRLLVRGAVADELHADTARRSVEALRDALPGVRVESTIAAAPQAAQFEQARALIARSRGVMISETGRAAVLLDDGRAVLVGAHLTPSVKLTQVAARSVVVESGGQRASFDLPTAMH